MDPGLSAYESVICHRLGILTYTRPKVPPPPEGHDNQMLHLLFLEHLLVTRLSTVLLSSQTVLTTMISFYLLQTMRRPIYKASPLTRGFGAQGWQSQASGFGM